MEDFVTADVQVLGGLVDRHHLVDVGSYQWQRTLVERRSGQLRHFVEKKNIDLPGWQIKATM